MDSTAELIDRYRAAMDRVARAAEASGRSPREVMVVAVSKYADMDQVRALIEAGHRDFGESQAQQLLQRHGMVEEMMARRRTMPGTHAAHRGDAISGARPAATGGAAPAPGASGGAAGGVRWHMIGHLQRNKVKKLLPAVRLIHSVDSLRLVEEIQMAAMKREDPVDVLVQVNCSGERSKHGCAVGAAMHLVEQIDTMVHLRPRGLMTMAPHSSDPADARECFLRCRECYEDIRRRGIAGATFNILSMGMTGDFETAIACGANLVRIGSAIFGEPALPETDDGEDGAE